MVSIDPQRAPKSSFPLLFGPDSRSGLSPIARNVRAILETRAARPNGPRRDFCDTNISYRRSSDFALRRQGRRRDSNGDAPSTAPRGMPDPAAAITPEEGAEPRFPWIIFFGMSMLALVDAPYAMTGDLRADESARSAADLRALGFAGGDVRDRRGHRHVCYRARSGTDASSRNSRRRRPNAASDTNAMRRR